MQIVELIDMMKDKLLKLLLFSVLLMGFTTAFGQTNYADFRIKTQDGDGKSLSGVEVKLFLNDIEKASDTTDSDGNAIFQTLNPGTYRIEVFKNGFSKQTYPDVELTGGLNEPLKVSMTTSMSIVNIVTRSKGSVIALEKNESNISGKNMINTGRRGIGALTATNSAIIESRQGISVRGTRADGNGTFVDGMRVIGGGAVPNLGVDQLSVSIGGIPAMYGDLTGGAFSYTSKSATEKFITIFEGGRAFYI